MPLWRISAHCTLNGSGGEKVNGRWHTAVPGKPVVYLAEHPAVALVESLANLKGIPEITPTLYRLIKVEVVAGILPRELELDALPGDWHSDIASTRRLGDAWLAEAKSALLKVPSVPSPESWNYLLNPLHPDARKIGIDWCRWITYDRRIFGIREKSN